MNNDLLLDISLFEDLFDKYRLYTPNKELIKDIIIEIKNIVEEYFNENFEHNYNIEFVVLEISNIKKDEELIGIHVVLDISIYDTTIGNLTLFTLPMFLDNHHNYWLKDLISKIQISISNKFILRG